MDVPARWTDYDCADYFQSPLAEHGREPLVVVSEGEVRRPTNASVVVSLSMTLQGATCDQSNRQVFTHGIDFYEVTFKNGRAKVVRTVSAAL